MIERYVNCGSWEQVAQVTGYSREWSRKRCHEKALKAFGKIFEKELRELRELAFDV